MLNYNQALPNDTLKQDLQIKEIKPIMKLIIRGKKREFISAIGKSLNILLPTEANTSTQSDKLSALWLSPDEWMIFSNEPIDENTNDYQTEKLLNNNISKLKKLHEFGCSANDLTGTIPSGIGKLSKLKVSFYKD